MKHVAWFLLALPFCQVPAHAQEPVDLRLVLAVDASGSVDEREYDLQLQGIARAFRDPDVLKAIEAGATRSIAVNVVPWAEHQVPKIDIGWYKVSSAADAERLARTVETMGRTANGATGMGEGLAAALRLLEEGTYASPRNIVDISGDGAESPAREYVVLMPQARSMAIARSVIVNGLAILGSEDGLEDWYRANVLTGHDAFLEIADGYEDFASAIRRKLLREIEPLPRVSQR
jgi:hypothetical protein